MRIRDIPESCDAFERFNRDYEARQFRFTETNRAIGTATRELFVSWFPSPLVPVVRGSIHALLDDALLDAFGFPRPSRWFRWLVIGGLKLRARAVRYLPPRRRAHFFSHDRNRSHPDGYRIDELGPPDFLASIDAQNPLASRSAIRTILARHGSPGRSTKPNLP